MSWSEPAWKLLPSARAIFSGYDFYRQGLHTQADPTSQDNEESKSHESVLKPNSDLDVAPSQISSNDGSAPNHTAMSDLKASPRHNLAMIFTCNVCETRSVRTFSRESYEKGVVVARCGGCNNLHLIADHLGWFGEEGNVEEILSARGEEVKKGYVDTYNLTFEDLAGKKFVKQ